MWAAESSRKGTWELTAGTALPRYGNSVFSWSERREAPLHNGCGASKTVSGEETQALALNISVTERLLSLSHSFWRSENRVEAWNKFPWRVQIRAGELKWGAAQLPPQTPGWFLLPGVGSNITSVSQSKDRGFRDTDLVTYQRTVSPILESKKKNSVILCFKTMKIFLLQFFLIIQYEQPPLYIITDIHFRTNLCFFLRQTFSV